MLSPWKNGITDRSEGHDLRLPTEVYAGTFQARHWLFIRVPVSGTIGSRQITKGFKFQLWDGPTLAHEFAVEIVISVDWFGADIFGAMVLSLVSFRLVKETIRATVINGREVDKVQIVNSATTSGKRMRAWT